MSLVLLITIIVTGIILLSIIVGLFLKKYDAIFALFLLLFVASITGFGLFCGALPFYTEYQKLNPSQVEYHFFENSKEIVMIYQGKVYTSNNIEDYYAIQNLGYFVLEFKLNGYYSALSSDLHIIEKGKQDDYIKK